MGKGTKYNYKYRKLNEKPKELVPKKTLKECDVGITEFVSKTEGFTGVLKARFSDFHVNEIDPDGNIIVLTDQTAPKPAPDGLGTVKLHKTKKDLEAVLTDEVWTKIDNLLKNADMTASIDIDVTDLEKDKRTLVHKTLKEIYGNKIISTTDTIDDKKFISCSKSKGGKGERRTRWTWTQEYVYFVMHKENTDTVQAASDMAMILKLPPSGVNYAGTKDKRAKTTQRFCVKKREPEQIVRACKRFPNIQLGNFEFKDTVLKLGDLKGNRFRVALRHVDADEEKIIESLENMKQNGFINYYGLQRFGNCSSVPTYDVGIALMKGNYKEAAELILKPREGDLYFLKEAREQWWKTRNSAKAAAMINNNKFIEKKLWTGLARFGENDYCNSLRRIPRNMLLLYTHAFQSLIWNKVASKRIAKYGLNIIPGDLVFKDKISSETSEIIETTDANTEQENPTDEEIIKVDEKKRFKQKVQTIPEEELKNEKYTVFDIVLPLPGYDVTYPDNELKTWYDEFLAEYDLSSEKLKTNVKQYSLAGTYRKLFTKPENMSWEFKRYNSPTSVLIASDYEKLKDKRADDDIPDGSFKALLLDFCLPSSAYATMALREILKADTSSMNQAKLENEEMKKFEKSKVVGTELPEGSAELQEVQEVAAEIQEVGAKLQELAAEDNENKRKIKDEKIEIEKKKVKTESE